MYNPADLRPAELQRKLGRWRWRHLRTGKIIHLPPGQGRGIINFWVLEHPGD